MCRSTAGKPQPPVVIGLATQERAALGVPLAYRRVSAYSVRLAPVRYQWQLPPIELFGISEWLTCYRRPLYQIELRWILCFPYPLFAPLAPMLR